MKSLRLFLVNMGPRTFSNFRVVPPVGLPALAVYLREKFLPTIMVANQRLENCAAAEIARRALEFEAHIVGLSALTTTACLLPDTVANVRGALPGALGRSPIASVGSI